MTRIMSMLPDDTYDVIIIDATDDAKQNVARLEVTITSGAHKGDVVSLKATNLARDALQLLGEPARLHVRDGVPTLDLSN